MLQSTEALTGAVRSLLDLHTEKDETDSKLAKIQKQIEYLNEASKVGSSHPVHTLVVRYAVTVKFCILVMDDKQCSFSFDFLKYRSSVYLIVIYQLVSIRMRSVKVFCCLASMGGHIVAISSGVCCI